MGNALHVIFHYFIVTHAGVVHVEYLLLHKGDVNNVLPTAITYRSVPQYGYCVSCRCTMWCVSQYTGCPALLIMMMVMMMIYQVTP